MEGTGDGVLVGAKRVDAKREGKGAVVNGDGLRDAEEPGQLESVHGARTREGAERRA